MWAATDIVLLISASANALTAVAALALPALMNVRDKRREAANRKLTRAHADVDFLLSNVDRLTNYLGVESMRLAFMESSGTAPDEDLESKAIYFQFQAAAKRVSVLSRLVGVDPSKLDLVLAEIIAHRPRYVATKISLSYSGGDEEQKIYYTQLALLLSRCVDAATEVLQGLEAKLG
jgi:hypothetical protein